MVTDTNLPVVVSPKGGPGKTTVAVIIGDALASRLPNQRIAAIDFNPGGGALEAVATEDRAARYSMLELHDQRRQVRSHAQLQPYVASLHSGLDLLAVPPDPSLALSITPEHYAELFDRVLMPNYNVLVLDTSPDITSPVTQLALQRGTQMIIVLEQGYVSSGVVIRSLPYLLAQPAAGERRLPRDRRHQPRHGGPPRGRAGTPARRDPHGALRPDHRDPLGPRPARRHRQRHLRPGSRQTPIHPTAAQTARPPRRGEFPMSLAAENKRRLIAAIVTLVLLIAVGFAIGRATNGPTDSDHWPAHGGRRSEAALTDGQRQRAESRLGHKPARRLGSRVAAREPTCRQSAAP